MKSPIRCAVLLATALLAGCASPPDPYGFTEPAHESWVWPENITLASSDWKDAGADSPEHALETFLWASKTSNTERKNAVTFSRMGYKQQYAEKVDGAGETPCEAAAHVGLDESFEFYTVTQVEKLTAGLTDEERLRRYEYWLRPYIRGPLAMRNIGTPESPIPEGVFRPPAKSVTITDVAAEKLILPGDLASLLSSADDFDPILYKPKPMLDVTILASKVISHTEVELDVREHFPAESGHPSSYFYVPCDFQLMDGTTWKLIIEQGFHTHHVYGQGSEAADSDEFNYSRPPTAEEQRKNPGSPVQFP